MAKRNQQQLDKKPPRNVLITIDNCVASDANYSLLHLMTKLYAEAYRHKLLPYQRKMFLVLPEQILRETSHVHNPLLLHHIMGSKQGSITYALTESTRSSTLARYNKVHENKPNSKVVIYRTGYCDGFSNRLSKKVLPAIAHKFLALEKNLNKSERRALLEHAEQISVEEALRIVDEVTHYQQSAQTPVFSPERARNLLALSYSMAAEFMEAMRDKRHADFIDNPRIINNLQSPAVIQTLKTLHIWVGKHEGKMQKAHRDCGDFAILQMYRKHLYRDHGSWAYVAVSKDDGLLANLSTCHFETDEMEKLSHPEYKSKKSKQYSLRVNKHGSMPALTMRPYEFYIFALQAVQEVAGIDANCSFSFNQHMDMVLGVEKWLKNKGAHLPEDVTSTITQILERIKEMPKDIRKPAEFTQKLSKDRSLTANILFTRHFINTNVTPDKNDFKPEEPVYYRKIKGNQEHRGHLKT